MRGRRRSGWRARAPRTAVLLLVALVVSVGSPPVAGATTPPTTPDPVPTTTASPTPTAPLTTAPVPTTAPMPTTAPPTTAPTAVVTLTTGAPPDCAPPCPSASPSPSTTPVGPVVTPAAPTSAVADPPYGTIARPVIPAGGQQTATGHDFTPGSSVRVTLLPEGIDLGTHVAAPDGTVTTRFATTGLLVGDHTVRWSSS